MNMTVRAKLFLVMTAVVAIVSVAYVGTTQGYLGSLFASYAEDPDRGTSAEQIEQIRDYVLSHMRGKAINVTLFVAVLAIIVCFWLSGMLTRPLRRLTDMMAKVASKELDVEIPVRSRDEFGLVGEAFNQMTHQLRQSENRRKQLVEDVAHELRTPLSIVLTKLELIQQSRTEVKPEALLPLHDELLRLTYLVEELQLLSSAEAGELALHKVEIGLVELAEYIADLARPEAEASGITLHGPEADSEVWIEADARRVKQILLNLLANAIRHTPPNGDIRIVIEAPSGTATHASIIVRDTGPGIPQEAIPYLFERFYRGESANREGTGLGLAIADQIALAHGGRIEARNRKEGGAEFEVLLPASALKTNPLTK